MILFYISIVFLAAVPHFGECQELRYPPVNVISLYSNSIDVEWEYTNNYTIYKLTFITIAIPPKIQNIIVNNNKATIYNISYSLTNSHTLKLLGVPNQQCGEAGKEESLARGLLPITNLPKNTKRQVLESFQVRFNSKNRKFTASWKPVQNASHYILTYRANSSCVPAESKVITTETQIETADISEMETNELYTFNIRVLNYTTTYNVSFPKADQLEVFTEDSSEMSDSSFGLTSSVFSLLITTLFAVALNLI